MGNSMKKSENAATTPAAVTEIEVPQETGGPQKNGGVVRRRKRGKKNKKDRSQKGLSCPPDIGGQSVLNNDGATPYTQDDGEAPRVKIKLYRSYADLDKFMQEKQRQSRPDLKWYRRSTGILERVAKRDKTKSLPRNYEMDYSRDSGNESAGGSFLNGTVMSEGGTPGSEYGHPSWNTARPTPNGPTMTSTPSNNNTIPPKEGRRSNASSNSQSIPSVPECKYFLSKWCQIYIT